MEKKLTLDLYDNDTVKWRHERKLYCLHIQTDDTPMNPRRDFDNITTMACWHSRYRLGDKLDDKTSEDFWQRLVRENVPESEIYAMAEAGRLDGIRIAQNGDDPELVDVYETSCLQTVLGKDDPKEYLEYEGVEKNTAVYHLLDDLTIRHCMTLMEPYAEWMPLWLYDHSGITMSCGARTYPYNDRWDSGQVGWIVALKKMVMAETVEFILDKNGERILIEHKHEGNPSTWGYATRPLTDGTWRKRACEIMEADVEIYDLYLTGEVFGYTLYEQDEDGEEWSEEDSCWGFFGADIVENGICDQVGCGLMDAIRSDRFEVGKASLVTVSHYEF